MEGAGYKEYSHKSGFKGMPFACFRKEVTTKWSWVVKNLVYNKTAV